MILLLWIHRNGPVARRPGRSRILESEFSKPHRLKFYPLPRFRDECKQGSTVYGDPTAPAESSPLHWSREPIMPLHFRAGQTQPLAGPGFETPTLGV